MIISQIESMMKYKTEAPKIFGEKLKNLKSRCSELNMVTFYKKEPSYKYRNSTMYFNLFRNHVLNYKKVPA